MISLFAIIFLCTISGCSSEIAIEENGLYVFTKDTSYFDEYAIENFARHAYAYYNHLDPTLKLGKGIYVYEAEFPSVHYPVWKNDEVVGTFKVYLYEGQYSGSYSNGNETQYNYAIGKTSVENPLKLLSNDTGFYCSFGDDIYNMAAGDEIQKVNSISAKLEFFSSFLFANGKVVNAREMLEYIPISSVLVKSKQNNWEIENYASIDDIKGWDVDIEDVDSVELHVFFEDKQEEETLMLSYDEAERFIHAFNAIQHDEIYKESSLPDSSFVSIGINKKDKTKIEMNYVPMNTIVYNHTGKEKQVYKIRTYLEIFDVIRELQTKYRFSYIDWELQFNEKESEIFLSNHFHDAITSPEVSINEVLMQLKQDMKADYDMTFNELLEPYQAEHNLDLNDCIETEDLWIKIIEMKDNRVTALSVSLRKSFSFDSLEK